MHIKVVYTILYSVNWRRKWRNLLQGSCLENPRDGRAWWAAVYGVAQSRTRLKRLSSSSSSTLLSMHSYYVKKTICILGGIGGKEPACQCRKYKRPRFNPWGGKIPWRRAWYPTPVFLPGESHGQGSLVGYGPWGHNESDTTGRLSTCPGIQRWEGGSGWGAHVLLWLIPVNVWQKLPQYCKVINLQLK